MSFLMGVDLGTSGVKSVLMRPDGTILASAYEEYDVMHPAEGWAEQDMERLWQATARTIRTLTAQEKDVAAVGLSGQMHGLVAVDKDARPVYPAILWCDGRTQAQIDTLYQKAPNIREITLNPLSPGFYVASLLWLRENRPELYEKVHMALLPKDYIRYKLCGQLGTEVSDASGTLAFDTAKRAWSLPLMDAAGLDNAMLPPVFSPCTVAGEVTPACAETTGLPVGTPVAFGGGDSFMHSLGNGIVCPGVLSVNIGTAGQVSSAADTPVYDPQFRTNTFCHVPDNTWLVLGGHLNGGATLKWLRDLYFPHMSYKEFDAEAGQVAPGSDGALFLPYLSGERTPLLNPKARGVYFGMGMRHGRGHMINALMEGVALAMRYTFEIFTQEMKLPCHKVISSGGGAKSKLWLQRMADILNADIYTVLGGEEACTGAAITAGVAVGLYDSVRQACQTVVRYSPEPVRPQNAAVYDQVFPRFKTLYTNNLNLFV